MLADQHSLLGGQFLQPTFEVLYREISDHFKQLAEKIFCCFAMGLLMNNALIAIVITSTWYALTQNNHYMLTNTFVKRKPILIYYQKLCGWQHDEAQHGTKINL